MTDTLKSLKIAYIFIVTAIVYFAFIPAFSKRCRRSALTLGLMNSFAGGVFLAMAFVHILPEAAETYNASMATTKAEHDDHRRLQNSESTEEEPKEEHAHEVFPLPYVLFFCGYAVVLLVDRVFSAHFGDSHGHGHGHGHGHDDDEDEHQFDEKLEDKEKLQSGRKSQPENHHNNHDHKHEGNHVKNSDHPGLSSQINKSETITMKPGEPQNKDNMESLSLRMNQSPDKLLDGGSNRKVGSDDVEAIEIQDGVNEFENQDQIVKIDVNEAIASEDKSHYFHHHIKEHNKLPKDKKVVICGINITPLVLLIALGFHSVFEGIALGLIKDLQVFINLMIGVTIHHIVACISYGVSLGRAKNKSSKAMVLSIVGLSLFESGGLAIGLGLSDAPDFVSSIILSFAGGTFVYIACSEILVHEFSEKKHRYWKFLMFLIGAAIITCLWFLHAEES